MVDMVQNKVARLAHEFCVCMWPIECKCGQCCSCVRVGFLCFCLFILIVFFLFSKKPRSCVRWLQWCVCHWENKHWWLLRPAILIFISHSSSIGDEFGIIMLFVCDAVHLWLSNSSYCKSVWTSE